MKGSRRFNFRAPALAAALLAPAWCSAAVLQVDRTNAACSDGGGAPYCTISAAITAAASGDTVQISAGTYHEFINNLTTRDITLSGAGAANTIIDGSGFGRVVVALRGGKITIRGVTITNGGGSGIVAVGVLEVFDSVISNNSSPGDGGGIYISGDLTVVRCLIIGNAAQNNGGGIRIPGSGSARIEDSTIANNSAASMGGGLLTLAGTINVSNSTISGNSAAIRAGGMMTANGVIANSTIVNNVTGFTGALFNDSGTIEIRNSIVAGNTLKTGVAADCYGTITSGGHNYVGSTDGCTLPAAAGDLLDLGFAALRLGTLGDHGGPRPTHPLLPGSPAIDAGNPAGCIDDTGNELASDERGGTRPYDGDGNGVTACDMGAYEVHEAIRVTAASLMTTEAGGNINLSVVLSSAPTANVILNVASSDTGEGTVSPASLTFTPSDWNTPKTVSIMGMDDTEADGDTAYAVAFDAASSDDIRYDGFVPQAVQLTNMDNETVLVNTGGAPLYTTESGGTAAFRVVLTRAPTAPVSIAVASSDLSEGTVAPATLLFTAANWNTPQTVTVTGVQDDATDGDVTYTITPAAAASADPLYAGIVPPSVTLANMDDDTIVVSVGGLNTTEAGGSVQFSVALSRAPTADVTIALASSDTTEGKVSPPTLTFTPADWNTPHPVTVTGMNDAETDGDVAYTITFGAASSADPLYAGVTVAAINLKNTDNDSSHGGGGGGGGDGDSGGGGGFDLLWLALLAAGVGVRHRMTRN